MVTTRRQSGKLPPPLTVLSTNDVETSEDEDAFGGYESSTDVTDSDDDDFDTKHPGAEFLFGCSAQISLRVNSTGRKGRPPAKRAKPNETPSKTAAKVKNKGTDLSGIVDIPLDVLFEVCCVKFMYNSSTDDSALRRYLAACPLTTCST
jgi:hypothetical protein